MEKGQRNKVLRWILISLGICGSLLGCALIVFVYLFLFGGPPKVITDEDQYAETMHKYTQEVVGKVHTGFFVFPQTIPESAFESETEPVFYFWYQDTWDDPMCEVYLKCTYSDKNTPGSLKRIPEEYLPDDYAETISNCTFSNGGYNVYVTEKTNEFKAYDYGERF